jgi:hypothetical protein
MVGECISSRAPFPWGTVFWLLVALAFASAAVVTRNIHFAIGSLLPFSLALAYFLIRPWRFEAQITTEGLEIARPRLSLAFEAIEAVLMVGKPGRAQAALQIFHAGGLVRIPARLNLRSDELHAFLLDQMLPSVSRPLPEELAKYCAIQEDRYGTQRVFAYRARRYSIVPGRHWKALATFTGFALGGLAYLVAGICLGPASMPWFGAGIAMAVIFGLFAVGFLVARPKPRTAIVRDAALVVCPRGLAMVQGDMRGELSWHEVKKIRLGRTRGFFDSSVFATALQGIHLDVGGATVTIADLYDKPLSLIHEQIKAYWQE